MRSNARKNTPAPAIIGNGRRKGRRPTSQPPSPSRKMVTDVVTVARDLGTAPIERLVWLMDHADSHAVQVAACREVLDRAYGKPARVVIGTEGAPIVTELVVRIIDATGGSLHPATAQRMPSP